MLPNTPSRANTKAARASRARCEGDGKEGRDIGTEAMFDARTQHLDRDRAPLRPVKHLRAMHLRD